MTVLATSGVAGIIPLLLVLACPLMMVFMMRGMHGGHRRGNGGEVPEAQCPDELTLDELKRERDRLNEQIAQRAEQEVDEARREKVFG